MLKIKKSDNILEKIWMTILSSILIIGTASVYYTMYTYIIIAVISFSLIITVFVNIVLVGLKSEINFSVFFLTVFYIISGIFLPIFWENISLYYIYIICILMPSIFLYVLCLLKRNKLDIFINILVKICVILASISIILWVFGSILRIIQPTGMADFKWGNTIRSVNTYFKIYFETQNAGLKFGSIYLGVKNNSIFTEAPICCFVYICASILNEMFIKNKNYRYVLVIMILSTLTTTGQLYIIILLLYYLFNWNPEKDYFCRLRYLMIIVLTSVGIFLVYSMLQTKSSTISGNDRITHIMTEWNYFKTCPIYGAGFDVFSNGTSNSIVSLLADGGVLLWGLYYFPLLWVVFYRRVKRKDIRLNCILYIIIFSFTASQYTPISLLMIEVLFLKCIYGGK